MIEATPAKMKFKWDIKDGNFKPEIIDGYELLDRLNGNPLKTALLHTVLEFHKIETFYACIERIA